MIDLSIKNIDKFEYVDNFLIVSGFILLTDFTNEYKNKKFYNICV